MRHFVFAVLTGLAGPSLAAAPTEDGGPVVILAALDAPQASPAALSGVLPLTVTLATAHPCPAPAARRDLIQIPQGCVTPWAGVLYTPQADAQTRAEFAAVDRVASRLEDELQRCRSVRTQLADVVAQQIPAINTQLDTVADLLTGPPPDPVQAPARRFALLGAALAGGGAVGGSGLALLLSGDPLHVFVAGAGGAVLGIGGALIVAALNG